MVFLNSDALLGHGCHIINLNENNFYLGFWHHANPTNVHVQHVT
jgi:hypothetical protein